MNVNEKSFLSCIRENFGFLEANHGYHMTVKLYSSGLWPDGSIEYSSILTILNIGKDRSSFWVWIRPTGEPSIATLSLQSIVSFLTGKLPKDFPKGPVAPSQYEHVVEIYADALRRHCMPFIRGDYSGWKDILKFEMDQSKMRLGRGLPHDYFDDLERYIDNHS